MAKPKPLLRTSVISLSSIHFFLMSFPVLFMHTRLLVFTTYSLLGALICRALLELMEDHNVHTFISLSGPQAGQYGDTDYLKFLFPKYTKETFYEIFYTVNGQMLSVANYWKDPNHLDLFEKYCTFLTSLNNASPAHKRNFLRIQQAVFIGGPDDGVVTPWQSSHFGFYGENGSVVEFQHQPVFTEDTFGLRTLYEAGNVTICTCPGVQHVEWPRSLEVFEKCIKPWLAE
jgi:palmitoyl-protein thioesterase